MIKTNGFPGLYIVFEGIGGSGKDTQISALVSWLKFTHGLDVVSTREPGGTPAGLIIREKILTDKTLSPEEETRLFWADRILTRDSIVIPALEKGEMVVQNRSVVSNMVYQGVGKGLGIWKVFEANRSLIEKCLPDVVVFLNIGWQTGIRRTSTRQKTHDDKFDEETSSFWFKIEEGYCQSIRYFSEQTGVKIIEIYDRNGLLDEAAVLNEITHKLNSEINVWMQEGKIRLENVHTNKER